MAPEKRAERSPEDPASVAIAEPEADERRPETTPGIFLEHFDLGEPLDEKTDCIAYKALWLAAEEAARSQGWAFRSYSSLKSRGTRADWIKRNVRSFPMLILFRDGQELGRTVSALSDPPMIVSWAEALLERGFK